MQRDKRERLLGKADGHEYSLYTTDKSPYWHVRFSKGQDDQGRYLYERKSIKVRAAEKNANAKQRAQNLDDAHAAAREHVTAYFSDHPLASGGPRVRLVDAGIALVNAMSNSGKHAPATIKQNAQKYRNIARWLQKAPKLTHLEQVTSAHLHEYVAFRRGCQRNRGKGKPATPIAHRTIWLELDAFRKAWEAAKGIKLPYALPDVSKASKPVRDVVSITTYERYRAAIRATKKFHEPEMRLLLLDLWVLCGMRFGDPAYMQWRDIFFESNAMFVIGSKKAGRHSYDPDEPNEDRHDLGGSHRWVPMPSRVRAAMERRYEVHRTRRHEGCDIATCRQPVFSPGVREDTGRPKDPWDNTGVHRALGRLGKKYHLPKLGPNIGRASAATSAIEGVDESKVQRIIGHTPQSNTMRRHYLRFDGRTLQPFAEHMDRLVEAAQAELEGEQVEVDESLDPEGQNDNDAEENTGG